MKWCPENKFEVTFFNSLLCSVKNFRFIVVFFISLAFTLTLFLIISDIYAVFFGHVLKEISRKHYEYITFGFNLYSLSIILVFVLDAILLFATLIVVYFSKKDFWVGLFISIPISVFVGWPLFDSFKWHTIFYKLKLYILSINYFLFFLLLIIIWILSFIFITFIVEKKLLKDIDV